MIVGWTRCPCGERAYASNTKARAATSSAHNRIRIYLCPKSHMHHVTDSDNSQRLGKSRQVRAAHRQGRRTRRHKARAVLRRFCA